MSGAKLTLTAAEFDWRVDAVTSLAREAEARAKRCRTQKSRAKALAEARAYWRGAEIFATGDADQ